jgi:hypothetical protein
MNMSILSLQRLRGIFFQRLLVVQVLNGSLIVLVMPVIIAGGN